jgi:acyl carrier protein
VGCGLHPTDNNKLPYPDYFKTIYKEQSNMSDVKTKLREFIVENFLFGTANGLQDDTSFLEEGIIDSTGVLELVTFLEENFEIQVADEELIPENLDSINNVAAYLERKAA